MPEITHTKMYFVSVSYLKTTNVPFVFIYKRNSYVKIIVTFNFI